MSLKGDIQKIFEENSGYANPTQAVNQASSLNTLSADLYTDSKRFIYELLQNADDSSLGEKAIQVWIKIFDDYLVVAHSGKPFSSRDVQGICNVNNGTKKQDRTKTGYKGIGFKSVFGQSEKVIIFSSDEYFRFDSSFKFKWTWAETKEIWEKTNDRKFLFPWQIIPIYTEASEVPSQINKYIQSKGAKVATIIKLNSPRETIGAIQALSGNLNMFLFLKNITKIDFDISKPISTTINRSKKNQVTLTQNGLAAVTWIVNNLSLPVPKALKSSLEGDRNIPEKLQSADTIELSLAAKMNEDGITRLRPDERLLYSYLPTDESRYSLPVLVNTSFLMAANRESLHVDSKWNQWIFRSIATEIFKWIAELVKSELQYQAYQLIPEKTLNDPLGIEFNKGIDDAIKITPFVLTRDNQLTTIANTIIDFTFLSEKDFVGQTPIESFITSDSKNRNKSFAANTGFGHDFKKLGADCFEWKHFNGLVLSKKFKSTLTLAGNIDLIKHLKVICESGNVPDISIATLRNIPFVWDHKNGLKSPTQISFPAADDQNWNNPESDLSFLHPTLQKWLLSEPKVRGWLETLGMTEKTDITYITQTILPQVETYITKKNAIETIQELFTLYRKGDLKEELIGQLSRIKLLTLRGSLCTASECFLSNIYSPRVALQETLEKDVFVSGSYIISNTDKDEWKRFFKMLGVKDRIIPIIHSDRLSTYELHIEGIDNEYFAGEDKKFKPAYSTFKADSYEHITSLLYLGLTIKHFTFSLKFWSDYVENSSPETINSGATAFWGRSGWAGQLSGNEVQNYVPWFIRTQECIPVSTGECEKSIDVLLNTEDISLIAGKYLPVFAGQPLSSDWKSFFGFRSKLELQDYLTLLHKISLDIDEKGKVKNDNYKRIQTIYAILLDNCSNWSAAEISQVAEWSKKEKFLTSKNHFSESQHLKYFLDGNESIFQDQFDFLHISAENKKHSNLEAFLKFFGVKILKQSDFELIHSLETGCTDLDTHLKAVVPYFKLWIEYDSPGEKTNELHRLESKANALKIYQANELKIQYRDIGFSKNVNVHINKAKLFVTIPWNANNVLLKLPETLCRYFFLIGHDKKLDFLLRSSVDEIRMHFSQEGIDIPEHLKPPIANKENEGGQQNAQAPNIQKFNSFAEIEAKISEGKISRDYFHWSQSDYDRLKYAEGLIERAVSNVISFLRRQPSYNCDNQFTIAKSIIGGITKNGNNITIVARPSDGNQVLLYYTSEFDVLEYVDAEFWYEDGVNPPRQLTMGHLLRQTGINRIPITHVDFSSSDLANDINNPKSDVLDFNAVPFAPQKIAMIISSFANTNGGSLVFGVKEMDDTTNEVIGLSTDFRIDEITNRAISLLSPIPAVTYDWTVVEGKPIFIINTEKSSVDISLDNEMYVRAGALTVLEREKSPEKSKLNIAAFRKTIAIVIAIENYAPRQVKQVSSVKYAENDARDFKESLMKMMNVQEEDIFMLVNEDALKSNIEYEFQGLFHALGEEDRLIFYYVGHGFHDGLNNYLSTYDVHQSNIAGTAVSLRNILLDPLQKSKCKNAIIFIDACARSFQDEHERNLVHDIDDAEFTVLSNEFPYYATFLSCQPGQSSFSSDVLKNGIWTHHLVKALNGEVPSVIQRKKYITDRLLQDYLLDSVTKFTKDEQKRDQNPKAILDSSCENVIVELGQ